MAEVGYASLGIIPSFKGFESKLNSGTTGVMTKAGVAGGTKFGDAAGKQAGSRFGGAFKTAAKASLIGLGALGVGAFKLAGDSVKAASDLEESTNKVAQVFGKGADSVFRFSAKAADAMGQTNQQARDAAATFGMLGKGAGFADKKNAQFSKRMTRLASDLASFSNTSPDEAIDALGAALRGESEPIRKYGVLLDEATLKAEAMSLGILKPVKDRAKIESYQARILEGQQKYNEAVAEYGPKSIEAIKAQAALGTAQSGLQKATAGTIPPLTQQQKVLAAQSSIFKQTQDAQGDFSRTSDGLANQQRRLSARFEDAKAKLGKGLLPIMTDAADFLLDKGIPAFEDFSAWFNKKGIPAIKNFADEVKPVVGKVKDLVGYLDDLPKSVKIGGLAALLAGAAALKLRGKNTLGGGIGGFGGAQTVSGALKVYVVNQSSSGSPVDKATNRVGAGDGFFAAATVKSLFPKIGRLFGRALTAVPLPALGSQTLPPLMTDEQVAKWKKAQAAVDTYAASVRDVPKVWNTVFGLPGLVHDMELVRQYGSMLDGLPREVRVRFTTSTGNNNDTGEGGGINPQPPGRSGVVVNHYGDIKSDSPRDYLRNTNQIARHRGGGGVTFP